MKLYSGQNQKEVDQRVVDPKVADRKEGDQKVADLSEHDLVMFVGVFRKTPEYPAETHTSRCHT